MQITHWPFSVELVGAPPPAVYCCRCLLPALPRHEGSLPLLGAPGSICQYVRTDRGGAVCCAKTSHQLRSFLSFTRYSSRLLTGITNWTLLTTAIFRSAAPRCADPQTAFHPSRGKTSAFGCVVGYETAFTAISGPGVISKLRLDALIFGAIILAAGRLMA